jgi:hypothetical protein
VFSRILLLAALAAGVAYWRKRKAEPPAASDESTQHLFGQPTGGTPATQPAAQQHLSTDDIYTDPLDAAGADSFPTSDPPSSTNPARL